MANLMIKKLLESDSNEERTSKTNSNFMNLFNVVAEVAGLDNQVGKTNKKFTKSITLLSRIVDSISDRFVGMEEGETVAGYVADYVDRFVPKVADKVVSYERHSSRDAMVATYESGRVEVFGTIEKSSSSSRSADQLPSITDFKDDATYLKSLAYSCNADNDLHAGIVTGTRISRSGHVYSEWKSSFSGSCRINYHYILW